MSKELAKELFYKGDYKKALELFRCENLNYEAGLCALLEGDEKAAKDFRTKDKNPDIATKWGLIVLNIINLKIKERPSFFQVRAFLEVYINLFIATKHYSWAENLISACDIMVRSNPEAYKFIARALFANGYLNLTHKFLDESKKLFYNDPEAHFIEAQSYYLEGKYDKALESIEETLKTAGEYYPAICFKKIILDKINPRAI